MTENEAKFLEKLDELANDTEVDMHSVANLNFFFEESANTIRKLFEEIQQYRELGAVEEIAYCIKQSEEEFNMLMEYRAIGTIEEFKALKEKSVAKKAKKSGVTDSNGVFHEIDGIDGVPYDLCPNCEINLCTDGMFGGNRSGIKFCKNCGQKLDWSE